MRKTMTQNRVRQEKSDTGKGQDTSRNYLQPEAEPGPAPTATLRDRLLEIAF